MMAQLAALCAGLSVAASTPGGRTMHGVLELVVVALVALSLLRVLIALTTAWLLARRAARAGAPIPLPTIIFMRLRKVDAGVIVRARIAAWTAGLDLPTAALEAHAMAGGDVARTVQALCAARAAAIPLSFDRACAIELAGRDAALAVAGAITPRAMPFGDALPAGAPQVAGTTRDGVILSAGGTATVRLNLERLVGGAGEDVLRRRLGEAISAAIGARALIGDPRPLSQAVLAAGLDAGTAFTLDDLAITLRRTGMHRALRTGDGPQP
jgi:uncharacterized protein YqfA (UPF0365 family)